MADLKKEKPIEEQYREMIKRKEDAYRQSLKQDGYFHPNSLTLKDRIEDQHFVLRNYKLGLQTESNLKIMQRELNPIPEHVRVSLEKNVGKIITQDQGIDPLDKLNDPNRFYAVAHNKKGMYDSIEVNRQDGGWKLQIKSGFPEREQAIQHNMKLQNQIAKDFDYKPNLER